MHNLRELEDVCDHVGIMNHGKVIIERSLSDLQGSVCKIQEVLGAMNPMLMDVLPLSLEEIFIYELGGADYAVQDILF